MAKQTQFVINLFIINSLPPLRGDGGIATSVKYNRAIMRNFGVALAARDLRNEAIWEPMRKMAKRTQFLINRRRAGKPNTTGIHIARQFRRMRRRERHHLQCSAAWVGFKGKWLIR